MPPETERPAGQGGAIANLILSDDEGDPTPTGRGCKPPLTVRPGAAGWLEAAVQCLLDREDLVVVDDGRRVVVRGALLDPRRPALLQLLKLLRAAGVATPRLAVEP